MKVYGLAMVLKKYIRTIGKGSMQLVCVLFCICNIFLLSGCAAVEDVIIQKAGIMTDEEYEKYVELRNTGQLNEDGYYMQEGIDIDLVEERVIETEGPQQEGIRVTFARNEYLETRYFLDEEMQKLIEDDMCYIKPGSSIYVVVSSKHPFSNWYKFNRLSVYAYDDNGHKGEELFWQEEEGGESIQVLHIPDDYKGTEVSIQPIGKYEKHSVYLEDYYIDSAGQKQELSGKWVVNDKEIIDGMFEASPTESLDVDYYYDSEEYKYVSSVPNSFYHENGEVRFEAVSSENNIERYSVQLMAIDGDYYFDPSKYSIEHGKVTFKYKNSVISENCSIPNGGVIDYVAEPDSGYNHPYGLGQITVNVSEPDETERKIREAITFYANELVEVILPRPDGGEIEYRANGEILVGETCKLCSGTVITMKFYNWNGWKICTEKDEDEYTVTENKVNQSVGIKGIDINSDLFKESDQHKPILKIVVKESVQDAIFEISASGVHKDAMDYAAGDKNGFLPDWMGRNGRLIFKDEIGTDKGITLRVRNDTILDGEALRLEFITIDTDDNEDKTIQYITKLPVETGILLYNEEEIAESKKVYEEVIITAEKTKIVSYDPKSIDNAIAQIYLDGIMLEEGDVLETAREVKVVISPSSGYVVTGSKTDNGIYSDIMKYSKWEEEWEKIVKNHPIKKLWHVTLDTSDEYGDCVYKLDGKEVSGSIEIYEGQKLTLEYTLTDSGYQIDREKGIGDFVDGLIHKNKEQKSIQVSEELDGKTIKRSDYITIKEGEK